MEVLLNLKKTQLIKELKEIDVAPEAYEIFAKKAEYRIIKIKNVSPAQANILKQIALICGGDVAIPKDVYLAFPRKKFDIILFANLREIEKIINRLQEQPWMENLKTKLDELLKADEIPVLKMGNREIKFDRTYIMGIINITPDSFYSGSRYQSLSTVKSALEEMEKEGADFIDIGAESTRPGAEMLTEKEEINRLKPILPEIVRSTRLPVSIDTYKPAVAKFALDHGVKIVNDISGLGFHHRNKELARIIARYRAGLVIMHIKGTPKTMQVNPHYENLLSEVKQYFRTRIDFALQEGIELERIIIDPGLGFGKTIENNYELIERLGEFKIFKRPILVGHSRKSFIGNPFNLPPEERLEGTLGVEALLIKNGASILRVHDVLEARKVALLIDKITK
ncbi:MAG: dihydropteroate synthase [candidate division WOR-3 bacterium]|nr:dihydropteroate synthase [candidate division WOR-3 bacterium]